MSKPPPQKRRRVSDPETGLTKSKYWYDDGNVILQAENTQFKVHMSVLSRQSVVFRDMFAIPLSSEETPDGCPVIGLCDTSEDVETLLVLLYDTLSVYKRQIQSKMPITVIAAMLRLGRKYSFKHLRTQALNYLKEEFPDVLFTFDLYFPMHSPTHNLQEVIAIGHENSLLSILSPAYWRLLVHMTGPEIVRFFDEMDPRRKAVLRLNEPTHTLLGREKIRTQAMEYSLTFVRDRHIPNAACSNNDLCTASFNTIVKECLTGDTSVTLKYALSPHYSYKRDLDKKFCENCFGILKREHQTGREKLWKAFATHFGLNDNPDVWNKEDWQSDAESERE